MDKTTDARMGPAICAVVLAAGAGSRLGGKPKSLLELDGVPLIRRIVLAISQAGVDEIVVVLGHYAAQIRPAIEDLAVKIVENPEPAAGLESSQRIGLRALSGRCDPVIMALADQPLVSAADIAALIDAWRNREVGREVIFPQVNGKRGNPVLLSALAREQILAEGEQVGCRQWQQQHSARVGPFVTDNHRYRVDIDTEADLARFEQETGMTLRWPSGIAAS